MKNKRTTFKMSIEDFIKNSKLYDLSQVTLYIGKDTSYTCGIQLQKAYIVLHYSTRVTKKDHLKGLYNLMKILSFSNTLIIYTPIVYLSIFTTFATQRQKNNNFNINIHVQIDFEKQRMIHEKKISMIGVVGVNVQNLRNAADMKFIKNTEIHTLVMKNTFSNSSVDFLYDCPTITKLLINSPKSTYSYPTIPNSIYSKWNQQLSFLKLDVPINKVGYKNFVEYLKSPIAESIRYLVLNFKNITIDPNSENMHHKMNDNTLYSLLKLVSSMKNIIHLKLENMHFNKTLIENKMKEFAMDDDFKLHKITISMYSFLKDIITFDQHKSLVSLLS